MSSASATQTLACAAATISGRASESRSAVARLIGKRRSVGSNGAGLSVGGGQGRGSGSQRHPGAGPGDRRLRVGQGRGQPLGGRRCRGGRRRLSGCRRRRPLGHAREASCPTGAGPTLASICLSDRSFMSGQSPIRGSRSTVLSIVPVLRAFGEDSSTRSCGPDHNIRDARGRAGHDGREVSVPAAASCLRHFVASSCLPQASYSLTRRSRARVRRRLLGRRDRRLALAQAFVARQQDRLGVGIRFWSRSASPRQDLASKVDQSSACIFSGCSGTGGTPVPRRPASSG